MRSRTLMVAVALMSSILAACGTSPTFQEGPDAEVTHDGLTRVDNTIMDAVWARTDIDIRGVTKVMLQGVGVEYRPVTGPLSGRAGIGTSTTRSRNQSEFRLDEATKALFEEEMRNAFVEEMQRSSVFEIVDEPGPDTIVVVGGLLDVVSRVPPEQTARGNIFISSVGEATLVLEIRDSMSNAILIRAVYRRAAQRGANQMMESNTVTNRAEVRRLGRRWASMIREGLETLIQDGT